VTASSCARTLAALFFLTGTLTASETRVGTGLMLRVGPEAWLSPSQVQVEFVVPEGGAVVAGQAINLHVKIRMLPGQVTQLGAKVVDLQGTEGPVPASAMSWTAYTWDQSGTFTVEITFSLTAPADWRPGLYSGRVDLALTQSPPAKIFLPT
jgi:hypothetical protein